jgi:endo-1,4-beta-xylanase
MVAIFNLLAVLSAVARSLASPVDPATRGISTRGPVDFVLGNENAVQRRQSPNYDQDYTTGGDVVYTPNGNSFTVDWDTQNDFVVGVGWTTGNTR